MEMQEDTGARGCEGEKKGRRHVESHWMAFERNSWATKYCTQVSVSGTDINVQKL